MPFLDKLERLFGRFAIQNLALYLVIGQVAFVFAGMLGVVDPERLIYWPGAVLAGEWWRLLTFMFVVPIPAPSSLLSFVFLVFGWYLFYLMGSALESQWGAFRFNVFLFTSYVLTVALSFLAPRYEVTNAFILGSVFLAFAFLNPDFELMLFFILPVKIKWLAIITWALNLVQFVRGDLGLRLQIAAPVITFLVFFGPDILLRLRSGRRQAERRAERAAEEIRARHVCHVCGRTDRTNPEMDFRYCSKCAGDQCYCPDHIQNHAHVVAPDEAARR